MRYHEITEAPLGDFQVYGDRENEGSFAGSDLKAANNPKWLTKVKSHFSRTPFNFNVYLYNAPEGKFYPFDNLETGEQSKDSYTKNFQQYFRGPLNRQQREHLNRVLGVEIPRDRDAINIILTDNEGDEKVGLTPWILAHRVAHAVLQDHKGGYDIKSDHSYKLRQLIGAMSSVLISARHAGKPSEIFKFRSARTDSIVREGEYSVEMFTQYIVQGKITVNYPPVTPPEFVPVAGPAGEAMMAALTDQMHSVARGNEPVNRADLWIAIADKAGIEIENLREVIDNEVFLDNYFELQDFASTVRNNATLKRSVDTANKLIGQFLEDCVGTTFILGAAR